MIKIYRIFADDADFLMNNEENKILALSNSKMLDFTEQLFFYWAIIGVLSNSLPIQKCPSSEKKSLELLSILQSLNLRVNSLKLKQNLWREREISLAL